MLLLEALIDRRSRTAVRHRTTGLGRPGREASRRDVVDKPLRRLDRAVDALKLDSPDAAFHAVRIRAKRVRYAVEAVAPLFGAMPVDLPSGSPTVQSVLGDHQDTTVAEAWLREAAEACAVGALGRRRTDRTRATRSGAPSASSSWRCGSVRRGPSCASGSTDSSELEAGQRCVAVEHLHGLERELVEVLADKRELLEQVGRHRDDVAADRVGLEDVQQLARARPDQLDLGCGCSRSSSASAMSGTGSRPVSAMRPAKTEMHRRRAASSASATARTCAERHQRRDVQLHAASARARDDQVGRRLAAACS